MPLIEDGRLVEDGWTRANGPDDLGREGKLLVPLDLWQDHREQLLTRNGPLGLALRSDQFPDQVADDLVRFELVALEFPKFTDGRAYSAARRLRERHGYRGELRATGNVLRDQIGFMLRCGFDTFEVADERALDGWRQTVGRFGAWYQPAGDAARVIQVQRRRRDPVPKQPQSPADVTVESNVCVAHWAY